MMFVACRHRTSHCSRGRTQVLRHRRDSHDQGLQYADIFQPAAFIYNSKVVSERFRHEMLKLGGAFRPPKPDLISVPIIRLKFPMFKSHFYERNGGPLSSFDCAKSRILGVSLFEGRNLDREFTEFCSWPLFKFLLVWGKL